MGTFSQILKPKILWEGQGHGMKSASTHELTVKTLAHFSTELNFGLEI